MLRVSLRGIRAHLPRLAMSVVAVALGVSFVAGTFSLRTLMSGVFEGIVSATTTADVYVRGEADPAAADAPRTRVPLTLVADLEAVPGVDRVVPDLSGMIVLVGADGTAVLNTQAPSLGFGIVPGDETVTVAAGRAPVDGSEVALETTTLASSGLALGDETTVVLAGELVPVTVVGEIEAVAPMAGATLTFFDEATARAAFAPDEAVPSLAVHGGGDTLLADVAAAAGAGTEALTGADLRAETTADINGQLGFINTFLMVFALVALFVGGFIIANTFAMLTRLQQRELAMLRAIGAAPGQVFASVVAQAVVVGVVGSLLGVAGGQGLVIGLRSVLAGFGMDLGETVPLTVGTVVACLVIGTVVTVAAAALPARRAALVAPVEAMREGVAEPERSLRLRSGLGVLLGAVGAGAVALAAFGPGSSLALGDLGDRAPAVLGFGAALLLAGLLVGAPSLARAVMPALAAPLRGLRPLTALAQGNVTRNPRRTASTAGALMIGMTLVAAAAVLASSARASVADVVREEFTSDLLVQSATFAIPQDAVTAIADAPGVNRALAVSWGTVGVTGPDGVTDDVTLAAGDPVIFTDALDVALEGTAMADLGRSDVIMRTDAADAYGWELGDRLTLTSRGASQVVTIAAVVDTVSLSTPLIAGPDLFADLVPAAATTIDTVFVLADPGTDPAVLHASVADAVAPFVVLSVMDTEEFASSLAGMVDQMLAVLYALLGLSVVIAGLGIVNTLALSVVERTREIGLLRAVGLGRLQLAGTVAIESVLTAVFGTVLGLAVGTGLAAAMTRVLADQGLNSLVIPWAALGTMLGLAVVVGVLAAGGPAVRAARLPVLDAVSYE